MDTSFIQQLDRPYAGFPLWMWVTGGAVIFGVGYHFYKGKTKPNTDNTAQTTDTTGASNQFNYPKTLDQTSQTGSTNATVGDLPPQDYWPYNQLALPTYNGNLYNPINFVDNNGQVTQTLYG